MSFSPNSPNPYAPPQSPDVGAPYGYPSSEGTAPVPDAIVEPLRATRPWVIFLAIVGLLFVGLMAMGGLGVMVMGAVADRAAGKNLPFPMWTLGFVYFALGAIYALPCVGLIRYASSIGSLVRNPSMDLLGKALHQQRWFWKVVGIMTAIIMALYPLVIIGIVVAAMAKATH
jgi:hypothetical protein